MLLNHLETSGTPHLNQNVPVVYIIGGYSHSGKSTLIDYLRRKDCTVLSSSEALYKATESFHNRKFNSRVPSDRLEMIRIAETVLVPVFGRVLFARYMTDQVRSNGFYAFESIGGEEYDLLVANLPICHQINVNCRRQDEKPSADHRVLLPNAVELWRDGQPDNSIFDMIPEF